MNRYQEPKYKVQNGRIVNRQSGNVIPDDEPVIILRARDVYAAPLLRDYANKLPKGTHRQAIETRAQQFENWAADHPDRMKEPDTDIDEGWTTAGKMEIPPP